ncbi:unnamed protein product [Lymnaea stagnalis]|uniref:Uncharacterized protein n=1 Tax=Lymnaea stagnalis TaxID=6523 RepID=A0AAV2H5P6_LYMST
MTSHYKGRRRASYYIELNRQSNDALEEQNVMLMKEVLGLRKREARLNIILDSIRHRDICRSATPKHIQAPPLTTTTGTHSLKERKWRTASINDERRRESIGGTSKDSSALSSLPSQSWAAISDKNNVDTLSTTTNGRSLTRGEPDVTETVRFVGKPRNRALAAVASGQGHRSQGVRSEGVLKKDRKMTIFEEISQVSGSDFNSMEEYLLQTREFDDPIKTNFSLGDLDQDGSDALRELNLFWHHGASPENVTASQMEADPTVHQDGPGLIKDHSKHNPNISRRDQIGRSFGGKISKLPMSGHVVKGEPLMKYARRRHAQPHDGQGLTPEFPPLSSKLEDFRNHYLDQNDSREDRDLSKSHKALDASLHFRNTFDAGLLNTGNGLKSTKAADFSTEQNAYLEDVIQVIKTEESTPKDVSDKRMLRQRFGVESRTMDTPLSSSVLNLRHAVDDDTHDGHGERSKVEQIDQIKAELMEPYPVFISNKKVKMIEPSCFEQTDSGRVKLVGSCTEEFSNIKANPVGPKIEQFGNKKVKVMDCWEEERSDFRGSILVPQKVYFENKKAKMMDSDTREIDKIKHKLVESCLKFESTDVSLSGDLLEPVLKLRAQPRKAGVGVPAVNAVHTIIPPADDHTFKCETTEEFVLTFVDDTRDPYITSDSHSVNLRSLRDDVILNGSFTSKTMSLGHETSPCYVKSAGGIHQSVRTAPQPSLSTSEPSTPAPDYSPESFLGQHTVEEHGHLLERYENMTLLDRISWNERWSIVDTD